MMGAMGRRAMGVLVVAALLSAFTLPAQVLASCPLLHPAKASSHPCCPRPKSQPKAPAAKCDVTCDVASGPQAPGQFPGKQVVATIGPVRAERLAPAPATNQPALACPDYWDSSGLYLKVRVLRI